MLKKKALLLFALALFISGYIKLSTTPVMAQQICDITPLPWSIELTV